MKIELERVISLSYTLTVEGELIEEVDASQPLEFLFGSGYLLPKFEANLLNKKIGDSFDFQLSPEEGYGVVNSEAIVKLSKDLFKVDGKIEKGLLTIGNIIPMQDSEGNRLQGVVEKVEEESVTLDFNHPLAGSTLHFVGKVEAIREATEEELKWGGVTPPLSDCDSGGCAGCSGC
ncbi:MAG: FKBP-type peptidyl-prolyl cis-trans isomerase [Bacteroidales bacterium]